MNEQIPGPTRRRKIRKLIEFEVEASTQADAEAILDNHLALQKLSYMNGVRNFEVINQNPKRHEDNV